MGEQLTDLDLKLNQGGTLDGVALDREELPIAGAVVEARMTLDPARWAEVVADRSRPITATTDEKGRFKLTGIPPMPASLPKIRVEVLIDANGILHVSAKDRATNNEQKIQITSSSGLNDDEIDLLGRLEDLKGSPEQRLTILVERYGLALGVLTRGDGGSLLISQTAVSNHPGYRAEVVDTIGAGDSFTAVVAVGMLKGYPLESINEHANRVAAYVCSHRGAMVPLPGELKEF